MILHEPEPTASAAAASLLPEGRNKLWPAARFGHLPWALFAALAATACGDDPVAPPAPALRIEAAGTLPGVGAVGQFLPGDVRVRVVDEAGSPASGTPVRFRATAGGGRAWPSVATTDGSGIATTRWRLGDAEGPQTLEIGGHDAEPLTLSATASRAEDVDALLVEGLPPGARLGALVDGRSWIGPADDFRYRGEGPLLPLGDWREGGPGSGELFVFAPGRGMLYRPEPSFTGQADTLRFPGAEPVGLDLTVWLPVGRAARPAVESALLTAARIFETEGLGAAIRSVEFVEEEVTGDFLIFRCALRPALVEAVGRREGRINVYVVESVDGSPSRGQACEVGGDFVALARLAGPTLLAHELGHNLSLVHVDFDADHFDQTNVMHSASDVRDNLTEGQVVRAQLNAVSAVNRVFGHHDADGLRACFHGFGPRCPPMALRIWADGRFGPLPSRAAPGPREPATGFQSCRTGEAAAPHAGTHAGTYAGAVARRSDPVPPGRIARVRRAAARRAEADARWLLREGRPAWLRSVPAEAVDPLAAADAAEALLTRRWSRGEG